MNAESVGKDVFILAELKIMLISCTKKKKNAVKHVNIKMNLSDVCLNHMS